jgi:predicted ester cyclase
MSMTAIGLVMFLLLAPLPAIATEGEVDVTSLLEANKAVVMRAWDAFNTGDLDVLEEVFHESYVEMTPYGTVDQGGPERAKQAYHWMRSVFGEIHFEVEQLMAEGDFVFSRAMATGTHVGEFMGVPATGRPVRFAAVVVSQIRDGKHVKDWSFIDTMAILRQIGEVSVEPRAEE